MHRTPAGVAAGMIVETEAYIGETIPPATRRRTDAPQRAALRSAGLAYVYLNYGIHYLVNAVTEAEGHPAAVLIRALQPVEGLRLMAKRRAPGGGHIDDSRSLSRARQSHAGLGITLSENLRRPDRAAS